MFAQPIRRTKPDRTVSKREEREDRQQQARHALKRVHAVDGVGAHPEELLRELRVGAAHLRREHTQGSCGLIERQARLQPADQLELGQGAIAEDPVRAGGVDRHPEVEPQTGRRQGAEARRHDPDDFAGPRSQSEHAADHRGIAAESIPPDVIGKDDQVVPGVRGGERPPHRGRHAKNAEEVRGRRFAPEAERRATHLQAGHRHPVRDDVREGGVARADVLDSWATTPGSARCRRAPARVARPPAAA